MHSLFHLTAIFYDIFQLILMNLPISELSVSTYIEDF